MKADTARRTGRIVAMAVLGASAATAAGAATVQGSLRYGGLPVTSTFTTMTSGGGRVGAVLSIVDNGSQDPSTLPLVRR